MRKPHIDFMQPAGSKYKGKYTPNFEVLPTERKPDGGRLLGVMARFDQ